MNDSPTNLFADIPAPLPAELLQTLFARPNMRIERIVSHGHASPEGFWYDQAEHEWVVVLRGAAHVLFERDGRRVELRPGDYLQIPAHERHRVEWTTADEPTIWLAVFYG